LRIAQTENVGDEVGKLALGERNGRHRVLGQHDMRHDGARRLPLHIGDLVETRNIGIGLLLLAAADEKAVGAEARRHLLAVHGVGDAGYWTGRGQSCPEEQKSASREDDARIHGKTPRVQNDSELPYAPGR
jgi:hypothetical protein